VQLAASYSTAERLCYTLTSLPVSGKTRQKISAQRKFTVWASPDTRGKLRTPHDRMQPAFLGTYKIIAVPFDSRIVAQLPREHRLVRTDHLVIVSLKVRTSIVTLPP